MLENIIPNPIEIRKAFKNVKSDIISLKQNLVEWITYLTDNQKQMQKKIDLLEKRVDLLEKILSEKNKSKSKKKTIEFY